MGKTRWLKDSTFIRKSVEKTEKVINRVLDVSEKVISLHPL